MMVNVKTYQQIIPEKSVKFVATPTLITLPAWKDEKVLQLFLHEVASSYELKLICTHAHARI